MSSIYHSNIIDLVLRCILGAILIQPLLFLLAYFYRRKSCNFLPRGNTCLLVIAHPDDETMFFAPTISHLIESGVRVFVLCVTTGNADGLGEVRKRELGKAAVCLGIRSSDLTVLDADEFPDGPSPWPETERLARLIFKSAQSIGCRAIITFDERGVSTHPNHISCWTSVRFLVTGGFLPDEMQVFALETVNIFRKYSSAFDFALSWLTGRSLCIIASPMPALQAMRQHRSQLVWFRYLYLVFSRYVMINTLRVIQRTSL